MSSQQLRSSLIDIKPTINNAFYVGKERNVSHRIQACLEYAYFGSVAKNKKFAQNQKFSEESIRWYCKYGISYRDLEEMMFERGLKVDHTTLYRWVQHYAPEMEKRLRYFWKPSFGESWCVDETYS